MGLSCTRDQTQDEVAAYASFDKRYKKNDLSKQRALWAPSFRRCLYKTAASRRVFLLSHPTPYVTRCRALGAIQSLESGRPPPASTSASVAGCRRQRRVASNHAASPSVTDHSFEAGALLLPTPLRSPQSPRSPDTRPAGASERRRRFPRAHQIFFQLRVPR